MFCLQLDSPAASLNFISHKPGVSLMLLGPLLAVQTPLACGLAPVPSTGKLSPVSQLRLVFKRVWSCPCTSFWPWSAGTTCKDCSWTLPLEIQIAPSEQRADERTEATPVSKNTTKGNRLQYCKDNSLHIHHCMLGLREELNFLSHSFSHPSNSFSPPPDTSSLHHPSTKPMAKNRGRTRRLKNQPGLWQRVHVCTQTCTEHTWVLWWISRNAQPNNPAGCDLADATAVKGWCFYLLLQSPHASALCPCHRVWILAQQLLCHWHSDLLLHWWETEWMADSYGGAGK